MLLATVGFAAMTQVQSNERDDTYSSLRQSDLIRVLDGLAGTSQRAEEEIDRLRQTRDDLRTPPPAVRPPWSRPARRRPR